MGFLLLLELFIIMCVYVCILCTYGTVRVRMSEGSLQESDLSFHHVGLEGHQLRSSGLATGTLTHWAISSATLWVLLRLYSINSFKFKISCKSLTIMINMSCGIYAKHHPGSVTWVIFSMSCPFPPPSPFFLAQCELTLKAITKSNWWIAPDPPNIELAGTLKKF